jgi:hypothetical protein
MARRQPGLETLFDKVLSNIKIWLYCSTRTYTSICAVILYVHNNTTFPKFLVTFSKSISGFIIKFTPTIQYLKVFGPTNTVENDPLARILGFCREVEFCSHNRELNWRRATKDGDTDHCATRDQYSGCKYILYMTYVSMGGATYSFWDSNVYTVELYVWGV